MNALAKYIIVVYGTYEQSSFNSVGTLWPIALLASASMSRALLYLLNVIYR